ncbi:MAG: cation transporter [Epsilonproteobacteria bacterium]|nr:MAG: cation transporter [Campylobacterota bacterium]
MRLEQKATFISSLTAAVLVTLKMIVGIMSGSVAVLASAIDSFLDFSVSIFNYFALHHSDKAPDEQFNFGRSKLEPIAAVVEGTIISLSGLFIFYEAMVKIIHHRPTEYLNESIAVMLISIVITAILVGFLNYVAKKTNNMVIRADALHYKTDLFSNAAILIALVTMAYTDFGLIDPILGILIAIYMIYSAYPIIKEGVMMLMDAALGEEEVKNIHSLLENNRDITSFHHLRTRQSGSDKFIAVHVVFNVSITLYDAHRISDHIEDEISKLFPDDKVHSIIHMDPYDDSEINEDEY